MDPGRSARGRKKDPDTGSYANSKRGESYPGDGSPREPSWHLYLAIGIYGSDIWNKMTDKEIRRLRHEAITWQLCQFLHGEQGALLATAQIVDTVPWYEARQYGATQVMDEARHVEVYRRLVQEKPEHEYPVNPELKKPLDMILTDSRWDMRYGRRWGSTRTRA